MDDKDNNIVQTQTIVTLCKIITAKVLRQCLIFIYTGTIDKEYIDVQVCMILKEIYSKIYQF